ncbi:MAG: molybdopterin-binding protein [Chromatiales bacterium]|jgi:molybdopterin-biosynthesis enzyme MoeA-like protein
MTDKHLDSPRDFGLIVIGDEILFGQRQDRHLYEFRKLLDERGLRLVRCYLLPDDETTLTQHLRFSLIDGLPVFVCGGIGATPDDLTRACAARAANLPLIRHPQAVALLEERFGPDAYPTRIRMAELPEGCELIPNPYNRIPGFSLGQHFFLPGFPEMAWPMAQWVLDEHYGFAKCPARREQALKVRNVPESGLVPIMEALAGRFPGLKLFSLPHLGDDPYIELGFRGDGDLQQAFQALHRHLKNQDMDFEIMEAKDAGAD